MSISIVLRNKVVSKKGKKMIIIDGEEVKQFWFPEEVWELVKEFMITNRAKLLLKMKKLGVEPLLKIYWNHFSSDYNHWRHNQLMDANYTPTEERKRFIKGRIINGCETSTKYTEIMEKEFQVKPKNYDWLNDFAVGEEVIVRKVVGKGRLNKTKNVKAVVRKIGKILQVELYEYRCRWIDGQCRSLETFFGNVNVYRRDNLYKKGECDDKLFA